MFRRVFLVFLFFTLSLYSQKDIYKIATVPLDSILKDNDELRKNLAVKLNRSKFTKQVYLKYIDSKKRKLFPKKEKITIDNALILSKDLKLDIAIIMYKEEVYKGLVTNVVNTNVVNTNVVNTNVVNTNDFEISIQFDTNYIVQGISLENDIVFYSETADSEDKISSLVDALLNDLSSYYGFDTLNSIENPSNDIELNFNVNLVNQDETKAILSDKSELVIGDEIEITFDVNKEGYVSIFVFQADNSLLMLYPNDFIKDYVVRPNRTYKIPPDQAIYDILISGKGGSNRFFIIFTEAKQNWIFESTLSGIGFKSVSKASIASFTTDIKNNLRLRFNSTWSIKSVIIQEKKYW